MNDATKELIIGRIEELRSCIKINDDIIKGHNDSAIKLVDRNASLERIIVQLEEDVRRGNEDK